MIAALAAGITALELAAGYAVAGPAGLAAVAAAAAVAALCWARLRIPRAPREPRAARPSGGRVNAEFPAYWRIERELRLARSSRWQYGLLTQPMLWELLTGLLAGRRHIPAGEEAEHARAALGEDLWPLLDPARVTAEGSRDPGVSPGTLRRVIERMEDL